MCNAIFHWSEVHNKWTAQRVHVCKTGTWSRWHKESHQIPERSKSIWWWCKSSQYCYFIPPVYMQNINSKLLVKLQLKLWTKMCLISLSNEKVKLLTRVQKSSELTDIHIDPQLLFQRLVAVWEQYSNSSDLFQYELCSYPQPYLMSLAYQVHQTRPSLLMQFGRTPVPFKYSPPMQTLHNL